MPADPAVAEYLDHLEFERGMSHNTVAAYRRDLLALGAHLRARGVAARDCSDEDVASYFAGAGGDGATATVARRMAAVRGLFHHLMREGRRETDPSARLHTPKRGRGLPAVLSVEEVEAVLATVLPAGQLGQRDLALLELLYGCGLRASELVTLRAADVDLEAGLVRCIGKGDKERVVPLGRYAAAAVGRYAADGRRRLLGQRRYDELFLNARGRPLTRQGLAYILRRYLRAAGVTGKVSLHTFRHSFATHLLQGGADLRSVQEMLGHADVSTTQVYTHVTADHLREVFYTTHPRARRRRGGAAGAPDAAAPGIAPPDTTEHGGAAPGGADAAGEGAT